MRRAIIFGKGGHSKMIASFLDGYEITFIDKDQEEQIWANPQKYSETNFYLGIGDNSIRAKIFNRLKALKLNLPVCIGANAHIAKDVLLGDGVFIGAGAIVLSGCKIGNNTIINTLSSVDHDCIIGQHTQITAGVTLAGEIIIGENCYLGVKSAVIPQVKIGNNVQIMAGSLVTKDCLDNYIYGGYPSRIIKSLGKDDQNA